MLQKPRADQPCTPTAKKKKRPMANAPAECGGDRQKMRCTIVALRFSPLCSEAMAPCDERGEQRPSKARSMRPEGLGFYRSGGFYLAYCTARSSGPYIKSSDDGERGAGTMPGTVQGLKERHPPSANPPSANPECRKPRAARRFTLSRPVAPVRPVRLSESCSSFPFSSETVHQVT